MPQHRPRKVPPLRPRAGGLATALFLGGLAVSGAAAILVAPMGEPAVAQSAANQTDQPGAGTLPARTSPAGTDTVRGNPAANRPTAGVAPPSAIRNTTAVVRSDTAGKASVTNPLDHLPRNQRSGRE
ncbi:hypothetical protein [Methylobacterium planeticum]|uniref:Uncharacterized protein n=1 Tax=Methylobacterium planeticum TaxID=2615211 RepID=A0A6N6MTZ9_9HYPH|nr:hypothetical protein [Methylobacterium planeticum]KAB1075150.1 hypothetical protein F6X51_04485 [Methylobacterium planeticum]